MVGQHDIVALPEESEEIADSVPDASFKILKDAGHNPEAEQSGYF
jgi:pimeloyl-ACP methyl ester carboxylesterase